MSTDIPVKIVSATTSTIAQLVVFTNNQSSPENVFVAYRVFGIEPSTNIMFLYPAKTAVGATYEPRGAPGLKVQVGPSPTEPGAAWEIESIAEESSAVLKEVHGADPYPDNVIVVKNLAPIAWAGRDYDVGLYKDGNLLMVCQNVHPGDQATLQLSSKLFFGLVGNMKEGEVFHGFEVTTALAEYDLSDFPKGLQVTLSEVPGSGYTFSAQQILAPYPGAPGYEAKKI